MKAVADPQVTRSNSSVTVEGQSRPLAAAQELHKRQGSDLERFNRGGARPRLDGGCLCGDTRYSANWGTEHPIHPPL